jgi:hypothetical protein
MKIEQLYKSLDYVNHSREKRKEMALLVSENPQLVAPLLKVAFAQKDHISSKACWVLEFTAKENLPYIFPHLTFFTENLGKLRLHPSVRPMAKICEYLIIRYFKKEDSEIQKAMTDDHLENIVTACFDWMIGDHKVAAKAYSMTCLQLLGQKYDWIHSELRMVVEQQYAKGSAAFKARARMILAKLK